MAASSLLALIDDIATVLDDVALLTKAASQKTVGVLGDDLALNAQQVSGVRADRELPVVWAVAKGSALNKLILVPAALAISAVAPWVVTPLLMLGGLYLCFEGIEKLAHKWLASGSEVVSEHQALLQAVADTGTDLVAFERVKIKGAIRTDLVLSAEIIAITLGTVAGASFPTQVGVLSGVATIMTVGVYGIVAGIVKLDDIGLFLSRSTVQAWYGQFQRTIGKWILLAAPLLMKLLSIAGTAAMFLVGGGILTHGLPALHQLSTHVAAGFATFGGLAPLMQGLWPMLFDALTGVLSGAAAFAVVAIGKRFLSRRKDAAP